MEARVEYEPRPLFIPFHQRPSRWSCMVVHRRAGKTVACINDLIAKALYTPKKDARYAYIAPFYRQAKEIAWNYLKEFAKEVIQGRPRESELRIHLLNGSWITLYGADNPDALRGIYLDGVVLDEFGDMRPSLWGQVILPTLIDRTGWAVFIGTPKGKNQFYRIHRRSISSPDWYDLLAPASHTHIIPPAELDEMHAQMSDEDYAQEMECSFEAALRGAILASYVHTADMDGRIGEYTYDPSMPVHIAGDIGRRDATAMWFWQDRPDGIAVLHYEEHAQLDPEKFHTIFTSLPFNGNYGTLWLPHDAKARTFATGRSALEQFLDLNYNARIVPRLSISDGITASRLMLRQAYFNTSPIRGLTSKVEEGLDALRSYRYEYNEAKDVYSDVPRHDWASNGADGWRYLSIVARQGYKPKQHGLPSPTGPAILTSDSPTYGYTLDQLHQDRVDARGHNFNRYRVR